MLTADINQSQIKGGQRLSNARINFVLKQIEKTLKITGRRNISIAFVSPGDIKKINRKYRGKNAITDVLAFAYEQQDVYGEVLICHERAKKQADKLGINVKDEIIFLIIHGILHIFGFDHDKRVSEQEMQDLEAKILAKIGIEIPEL